MRPTHHMPLAVRLAQLYRPQATCQIDGIVTDSLRFRPLSKETLRLIKHQDGILVLRLLEDEIDILGALPHPLAQQLPAVHHLEWLAHLVADSLSHHGLASARTAMKEDGEALVVALGEPPLPKQYRPAEQNLLVDLAILAGEPAWH